MKVPPRLYYWLTRDRRFREMHYAARKAFGAIHKSYLNFSVQILIDALRDLSRGVRPSSQLVSWIGCASSFDDLAWALHSRPSICDETIYDLDALINLRVLLGQYIRDKYNADIHRPHWWTLVPSQPAPNYFRYIHESLRIMIDATRKCEPAPHYQGIKLPRNAYFALRFH